MSARFSEVNSSETYTVMTINGTRPTLEGGRNKSAKGYIRTAIPSAVDMRLLRFHVGGRALQLPRRSLR